LLFAYGVSNSGKTYTISGANTQMPEDRGVLPRAVDVVFNSIAGMQSAASVSDCQIFGISADVTCSLDVRV